MNATSVSRSMRYVSLAVVLVVVETSAPASVITTGDVDPVPGMQQRLSLSRLGWCWL